jgi:hypothetical protein
MSPPPYSVKRLKGSACFVLVCVPPLHGCCQATAVASYYILVFTPLSPPPKLFSLLCEPCPVKGKHANLFYILLVLVYNLEQVSKPAFPFQVSK